MVKRSCSRAFRSICRRSGHWRCWDATASARRRCWPRSWVIPDCAAAGSASPAAKSRGWPLIGFVPQEREIFPSLTVEENLTVAERPGQWSLGKIYEFFPSLAERRRNHGNQLSGGEQHMLAIGRAFMGNPTLP